MGAMGAMGAIGAMGAVMVHDEPTTSSWPRTRSANTDSRARASRRAATPGFQLSPAEGR
jgi:hypothetical protein